MDPTTLMTAIETAPARLATLKTEIEAREKERGSLTFFAEAVAKLRDSWKDSDPGKYGPHWYAFKGDKKTWPRELIDASAVARHVEDHRLRNPHWRSYDVPLAPLAELRQDRCPGCEADALVVCCYQQTYDSPGGDEWTKTTYLLCASCRGLYRLDVRQSDGRF